MKHRYPSESNPLCFYCPFVREMYHRMINIIELVLLCFGLLVIAIVLDVTKKLESGTNHRGSVYDSDTHQPNRKHAEPPYLVAGNLPKFHVPRANTIYRSCGGNAQRFSLRLLSLLSVA